MFLFGTCFNYLFKYSKIDFGCFSLLALVSVLMIVGSIFLWNIPGSTRFVAGISGGVHLLVSLYYLAQKGNDIYRLVLLEERTAKLEGLLENAREVSVQLHETIEQIDQTIVEMTQQKKDFDKILDDLKGLMNELHQFHDQLKTLQIPELMNDVKELLDEVKGFLTEKQQENQQTLSRHKKRTCILC